MKLVYFAWVRERVGKTRGGGRPAGRRSRPLPTSSAGSRRAGEEYAYAFENEGVVRAAIDRSHVKPDAPIAGAREIAFFPPMTGG